MHSSSFSTRRAALGGLLALGCGGWWPRAARAEGALRAELLDALRRGGTVVYFRHGATDKGGVDRIEWPRNRQRLLSAEGEAQARAVGEVFARHGLVAGEVETSPFARCHDFAEIAFGRVQDDPLLLGLLSEDTDRQARIDHSLARLRAPVAMKENRILVGHSSNIRATTGASLAEGAAVITRRNEGHAQGFVVPGVLTPEDWQALAEVE